MEYGGFRGWRDGLAVVGAATLDPSTPLRLSGPIVQGGDGFRLGGRNDGGKGGMGECEKRESYTMVRSREVLERISAPVSVTRTLSIMRAPRLSSGRKTGGSMERTMPLRRGSSVEPSIWIGSDHLGGKLGAMP